MHQVCRACDVLLCTACHMPDISASSQQELCLLLQEGVSAVGVRWTWPACLRSGLFSSQVVRGWGMYASLQPVMPIAAGKPCHVDRADKSCWDVCISAACQCP